MPNLENAVETPSMSYSRDITSLIGSKRKRKENAVQVKPSIKPILRGYFVRHQNKVTWTGCWALTKDSYLSEFGNNVVKAPFYFERKSLASENSVDNGILSQDGYFNGYFCMQDLSRQTITGAYKKFYEKEVLLRFVKANSDNDSEFDVVGSGQNKFGKYLIEGKFYSDTEQIHCVRNYLPNIKKSYTLTKKKPKVESPVANKRSSRIRTPSAKYMEAFGIQQKDTILSPGFEFEGKDLIIKLLSNFSERNESSHATRMLKDLTKRKIRSLKTAFKQLHEISMVVKDAKGLDDLKNGLKSLQTKYGLKVSKKRPLEPKLNSTVNKGKDCYTSLFENVTSIQEMDPLGLNLTCRLPEKLKLPKVTGMVDLRNTFEDTPVEEYELPAGGDDITQFISEIEETYPIHDVDFSDLSTLDAETLKELNAFVEFTCPSKGS